MSPPLRLFASRAPWASLGYLVPGVFLGVAWFSVTFGLLVTTGVLSILWVGLPLLTASLAVVRALAGVERRRVAPVLGGPIGSPYRPVRADGLVPSLRERLADPATWRDVLLLVVLWPLLLAVDTVAVSLWLALAGTLTVPLWYRWIPNTFDNGTKAHGLAWGNFPNGPKGGDSWGFFIGDLQSALIAAAVGLVLLLLVGDYVLVGAVRLHASITRALLRHHDDPLDAARRLLEAASGCGSQPDFVEW